MAQLVYFNDERIRADRISAVCKTEEEGLPSITIFIGDNPNPMVFPFEHVDTRDKEFEYVVKLMEIV